MNRLHEAANDASVQSSLLLLEGADRYMRCTVPVWADVALYYFNGSIQ